MSDINPDAPPIENPKRFLENDAFARGIGVDLPEIGPGCATAVMTVEARHLNGVRTCHGGALFTLADLAFAAACNSYGTVAVGIQSSIYYMKAAREGTVLTAVAEERTRNPRLGVYTVTITDDEGDTVASFEGLAYRKKDPYPLRD